MEDYHEFDFELGLPRTITEKNQRDPREFSIPNFGSGAFIVHEGVGRADHADRVVIHPYGIINLDGFGFGGPQAALIADEELSAALDTIEITSNQNPKNIIQAAQQRAFERMYVQEIEDRAAGRLAIEKEWGGTCMLIFIPMLQKIYQAGDVKMAALDKDWNKKSSTEDEHVSDAKHVVHNHISAKGPGRTTESSCPTLTAGDWIIIASDALWDNLSDEDNTDEQLGTLRYLVDAAQTPSEVASRLNRYVQKKMEGELQRRKDEIERRKENPLLPPELKKAKLDNFSIIVLCRGAGN